MPTTDSLAYAITIVLYIVSYGSAVLIWYTNKTASVEMASTGRISPYKRGEFAIIGLLSIASNVYMIATDKSIMSGKFSIVYAFVHGLLAFFGLLLLLDSVFSFREKLSSHR